VPPFGELFSAFLAPGGRISLAERIPRRSTRLSELVAHPWKQGAEVLREIEAELFSNPENPLINWDETNLEKEISRAGLTVVGKEIVPYMETRVLHQEDIAHWLKADPKTDGYGKRLAEMMTANERKAFGAELHKVLAGREVEWRTEVFFLAGEKVKS
jgi:putative ATPase